jgi:hypothetical protein
LHLKQRANYSFHIYGNNIWKLEYQESVEDGLLETELEGRGYEDTD